jgi:ribosomal protein S2
MKKRSTRKKSFRSMCRRKGLAFLWGLTGIRKIRIRELLFVEALWGHAVKKRNNINNKYLLGIRKNTDVLDTTRLITGLSRAQLLLKSIMSVKGKVLVVTEPGIWRNKSAIGKVNAGEWLCGFITNFKILHTMDQLPDCIVILTWDDKKLQQVVSEAVQMRVPVIVALDSNNDPVSVGYPIPINNNSAEALRSISAFLYESMLRGVMCYYTKFTKNKQGNIVLGGTKKKKTRRKKSVVLNLRFKSPIIKNKIK